MSFLLTYISGRTKVISDKTESEIKEIGFQPREKGDNVLLRVDEGHINYDQIESIYPFEEGASGVFTRPTPEQLRNDEKRRMEEIRSDPKALINRMQNKEGDEQE